MLALHSVASEAMEVVVPSSEAVLMARLRVLVRSPRDLRAWRDVSRDSTRDWTVWSRLGRRAGRSISAQDWSAVWSSSAAMVIWLYCRF